MRCFTFVSVFPDIVSHCKDHEGVLVPEPHSPPHGIANKEDSVQTGSRQ